MPRGGFRPGAGRPPGSGKGAKKSAPKKKAAGKPTKARKAEKTVTLLPPAPPKSDKDQVVNGEFIPAKMEPLEFMLDVMNNGQVDLDMRSRMAIAAAPYCHIRKGDGGKKEAKKDAAGTVSSGRFAPAAPPPRRPN